MYVTDLNYFCPFLMDYHRKFRFMAYENSRHDALFKYLFCCKSFFYTENIEFDKNGQI